MSRKLKITIAFIVSLIIVGVTGVFGYYLYSRIQTASDVSDVISKNVETTNKSTRILNETNNKLLTTLGQAISQGNFEDYLEELELQLVTVQENIQTIELAKTSILEGSVNETKVIRSRALELLNSHTEALDDYLKITEIAICFGQNNASQDNSMNEVKEEWSEISEDTEVEIVIQVSRDTSTKIQEVSNVVGEVTDCFDEQHEDYISVDFTNQITNRRNAYKNLSGAINKLANGLESFKQSDFEAAQTDIQAIIDNPDEYNLAQQQTLNQILDEKTIEIDNRVLANQQLFNEAIDKAEIKYNL